MIIPKVLTQLNSSKEIYNNVKQAGISVDVLINDAGFAETSMKLTLRKKLA